MAPDDPIGADPPSQPVGPAPVPDPDCATGPTPCAGVADLPPLEEVVPPWPVGVPQNQQPLPRSMRQEAQRLLHRLSCMNELTVQVHLLGEALRLVTREEAATLIAELLRCSAGHSLGRMVRLALMLALGDEELLPPEVKQHIRTEARERGDHEVGNLLGSRPPHLRPDRAALPPPPPGSPSRELTLGERRSLARRPDRGSLEKLLLDPEPMVIRNLLPNSRLTEDDVLRIASRRPIRAEVLREIYASHRWISRPRVQLALVLNPYCCTEIGLRLVQLLPNDGLRQVAAEGAIDPLISEAARTELRNRK